MTPRRPAQATIRAMTRTPAQLLLYRFGPDAGFEGQLLGALERMETGGSVRVLAEALEDAVARTGGTRVDSRFVEATTLRAELLTPAG
jgi:hypothetical protein